MFTDLIDFQKTFSTELKCIKYLEKLRWNDEKPICPLCKEINQQPPAYAVGMTSR